MTTPNLHIQQVEIGNQMVNCTLKYSARRKYIGLNVNRNGLILNLPINTPNKLIYDSIAMHQQWILDKIAMFTNSPPLFKFADGASIPILGNFCQLKILSGSNRMVWSAADTQITILAKTANNAEKFFYEALRRRARDLFQLRLNEYCQQMNVDRPIKLTLSSAISRWGSCNHRGDIRLNWKLIHFRLEIIDYVVVHELAHLREMNHQPKFWQIVAAIIPNYQALKKELSETTKKWIELGIIK